MEPAAQGRHRRGDSPGHAGAGLDVRPRAGNAPWVAWWMFALAAVLQVYLGGPYIRGAWQRLLQGSSNMDTLIALGTSTAFLYSAVHLLLGSFHEAHFFMDAGIILTLITLGKFLEVRSRGTAGEAIERLLDLSPRTARGDPRQRRGRDSPGRSPARGSHPGPAGRDDPGRRRRGRRAGRASTNRCLPVSRCRWTRTRETASPEAPATATACSWSRPDGLAAKAPWSRWCGWCWKRRAPRRAFSGWPTGSRAYFVPAVLAIALATLLGWGLVAGDWSKGFICAAAVLIIACPCALGLATPMAVAVATGRGAREGLFVREASAFERMDRLTTIVFDKTGTLTEGKPSVVDVQAVDGWDRERLLSVAAAAESGSEHPLAQALLPYCLRPRRRGLPGDSRAGRHGEG